MAGQIRLVGEEQAHGQVRRTYQDIKRTLALPFVPDVFRALGACPPLLDTVWAQIKPVIGTSEFEGLADRLRAHAIACARQRFYVPDHCAALEARGMSKPELDRIRDTVELFHQSGPRLLVISAAVRQSLAGSSVGKMGWDEAHQGTPTAQVLPAIKLASDEVVGAGMREVFEDAKALFGLPMVVTDLRTLATWPDYLRLAWGDVKAQLRSAPFRRVVRELDDIAIGGLRELSRPVRVDFATLRGAGLSQDDLERASASVSAFHTALPAVVTTVALLRLGLNAILEEQQLLALEAGA